MSDVRRSVLDVDESICVVNIVARLSHTAVVCRDAAAQTTCNTGPGGSDRSVLSAGSDVIALMRSLTAFVPT